MNSNGALGGHMKIKNVSQFAREVGISRQLAQYRIDNGWQFGILDGKKVWYDPKMAVEIKEENSTVRGE